MASYRLTPEAEEDLNRIWLRGVLKYGETQADTYFYDFINRFEQLAQESNLYPAVDEIRKGYRRSVCGVDSIYYRIMDDGVEIIRVLGKQDINEWL